MSVCNAEIRAPGAKTIEHATGVFRRELGDGWRAASDAYRRWIDTGSGPACLGFCSQNCAGVIIEEIRAESPVTSAGRDDRLRNRATGNTKKTY